MSAETEKLNEENVSESKELTHSEKIAETHTIKPEAMREIHEMFLKGYTQAEINPIISKKYGVVRSTSLIWIKAVLKRITDVSRSDPKNRRVNVGLAVERLLTLYSKAVDKEDYGTAFRCLNEIDRIQGLIQTKDTPDEDKRKKKKETPPKVDVSGLSEEELKRLVEGNMQPDTELAGENE
jgi:hypothetical protein